LKQPSLIIATITITFFSAIGEVALAADTFPHPVLPVGSRWPGYMFMVIAAMFVLAAVIGPVLRKVTRRILPPATHSHDEPPGTSGHHGQAGTHDPNAPDHFQYPSK
jgi:hypothetical protein